MISKKKAAKKPAAKKAAQSKKSAAGTKAKAPTKSKSKSKTAPKGISKNSNARKAVTKKPAAIAKKSPVAAVKKQQAGRSDKNPKAAKRAPVVQLSHGQDQHFIPMHKKDVNIPALNSGNSEKLFHNKEEVALRQENQRMKAITANLGKKRIFRIPGT